MALKVIFLLLVMREKYIRLCASLLRWFSRRQSKAQHLCTCAGEQIPKTDLGTHSRPDRYSHRMPRVDYEKLSGDCVREPSEAIRARVQAARDIQNKRFSSSGSSDIICNTDMRVGEMRQFCKLDENSQGLIHTAMSRHSLSARAYHRLRKLARTIADLVGC